jgi:type II secretion system protein L
MQNDIASIRVWSDSNQPEIGELFNVTEDQLLLTETKTNFDCLTELGLKQPQIDILQGFDAPKPQKTSSEGWKPTIALSIVAAAVYLGTSVFHYFSLQQQIESVTQQTEQLFRKTFPDVKRLVQPLVQAQQKLDMRIESNGQASDVLLDLLLALGNAKQSMNGIEFKNLEYRQNSMVVHLQGKSVAQIERFKQKLESKSGASSKILSTQSKEGRVDARIKINARST